MGLFDDSATEARLAGYSWPEINSHVEDATEAAKSEGYTQPEIDTHLGYQDDSALRGSLQTNVPEQVPQGTVEDPQPIDPTLAGTYATALRDGTTKDPRDFAGKLGDTWGLDPNTQDMLAAQLPHPEDLIDRGIQVAHAIGDPIVAGALAVKDNLLNLFSHDPNNLAGLNTSDYDWNGDKLLQEAIAKPGAIMSADDAEQQEKAEKARPTLQDLQQQAGRDAIRNMGQEMTELAVQVAAPETVPLFIAKGLFEANNASWSYWKDKLAEAEGGKDISGAWKEDPGLHAVASLVMQAATAHAIHFGATETLGPIKELWTDPQSMGGGPNFIGNLAQIITDKVKGKAPPEGVEPAFSPTEKAALDAGEAKLGAKTDTLTEAPEQFKPGVANLNGQRFEQRPEETAEDFVSRVDAAREPAIRANVEAMDKPVKVDIPDIPPPPGVTTAEARGIMWDIHADVVRLGKQEDVTNRYVMDIMANQSQEHWALSDKMFREVQLPSSEWSDETKAFVANNAALFDKQQALRIRKAELLENPELIEAAKDQHVVKGFVNRVVDGEGDNASTLVPEKNADAVTGFQSRSKSLTRGDKPGPYHDAFVYEAADGTRTYGGSLGSLPSNRVLPEETTAAIKTINEEIANKQQQIKDLQGTGKRVVTPEQEEAKAQVEALKKEHAEALDDLRTARKGLRGTDTGELKFGDKVTHAGEEKTIRPARTEEIENNSDDKFVNNLMGSLGQDVTRTQAEIGHLEFLKKWGPELKQTGAWVPRDAEKIPSGFVKVDVPQLGGYAHPRVAKVLNDYWQTAMQRSALLQGMAKINHYVTGSLFITPFPHLKNEGGHYIPSRGLFSQWLNPYGWGRMLYYGGQRWKGILQDDAFNQQYGSTSPGSLYNNARTRNFSAIQFSKSLHEIALDTSGAWGALARKLSYGNPKEMVTRLWGQSNRALWFGSELLKQTRTAEYMNQAGIGPMAKQLPMQQAIVKTFRDMPSYDVGPEVMGSPALAELLKSPWAMIFGRYRHGQIGSIYHMVEDVVNAANPMGKMSLRERGEAVDKALSFAVMYYAMGSAGYAGGATVIHHAQDLYQRGVDAWPGLVGSIATLNPVIEATNMVKKNVDFFGKQIVRKGGDTDSNIIHTAQEAINQIPIGQNILGLLGYNAQGKYSSDTRQKTIDQMLGLPQPAKAVDEAQQAKWDARATAEAYSAEKKSDLEQWIRNMTDTPLPSSGGGYGSGGGGGSSGGGGSGRSSLTGGGTTGRPASGGQGHRGAYDIAYARGQRGGYGAPEFGTVATTPGDYRQAANDQAARDQAAENRADQPPRTAAQGRAVRGYYARRGRR